MPQQSPAEAEGESSSARNKMPPITMYKYFGVSEHRLEWIRKLLVDSELYFPPPSAFNDPFDCRIPYDFNSSSLKIEQFWRHYADEYFPSEDRRARKKRISELVMKSKTDEGQRASNDDLFRNMEKRGILCLTDQPTNTLMWSYYAEGHKGIAIEFRTIPRYLEAIPGGFLPIEVQYSSSRPLLKFYERPQESLIDIRLGTKAKAWEHEHEWRIVLPHIAGLVRVPPRMISAVIFGLRTDKACEDRIREWNSKRPQPTKVFRIKNEPDSFELKLIEA